MAKTGGHRCLDVWYLIHVIALSMRDIVSVTRDVVSWGSEACEKRSTKNKRRRISFYSNDNYCRITESMKTGQVVPCCSRKALVLY